MRILGANDVGMYSPGIAALARAATAFGDLRVPLEELDEGPAEEPPEAVGEDES